MKTITASVQTEKASLTPAPTYLVTIGTAIFLTDWDVNVIDDGDTFVGGTPIRLISADSRRGSKIAIGNVDGAFSALIINGTIKNETILIREAFFDDDNVLVGTEILFSGVVDGQVFDDFWATLSTTQARSQAIAQTPRRRLVPACGFLFKLLSCGYTGALGPCAKDYDSCLNQTNFAGFRFVPEPGKKFTWGNTIYTVT